MSRFSSNISLFAAVLALVLTAGPASAQIDLRFTPQDTTIAPGDTCRIAVMLDDALFFRTIELTVSYDSTLVSTVSGGQGDLFASSGFLIWDGFEEDTPGLWHGFAIVMGATDSLSGPGELFAWDLEGVAEGTTPITGLEAKLYAPDASLLADVTLAGTTLRVRTPTPVPAIGSTGPQLRLQPNPFNPRTRVSFDLARARDVELAVYDARGRRVALLHRGAAPAGPIAMDWNGRSDDGMPQPAGLYLFRLAPLGDADWTPVVTKGILLE